MMINITLSEDGEQLRFYYPSVIDTPHDYLRDHVLIEFGIRNSIEPYEQYRVIPYLARVSTEDLNFPEPMVNTLSPIRTFWEKATLMHVECHRERLMQTPERLSRHWYDLFMLNNSWVGDEALSSGKILNSVIEYKKAFFNASYAHYDDCMVGKFCLIPKEPYLESLRQDFSKMVKVGMFHEIPPTISEIVNSLKILEAKINLMDKGK